MLTAADHIPKPLLLATELSLEFFKGNPPSLSYLSDRLYGLNHADWMRTLDLCLHERTAPTLPAEFIPIADYGVDGAQAGLVVHAPEIEQDDYPVGAYCEIDFDGVLLAGRDTRHFLEQRFSAMLNSWETMGQDVDALGKLLGNDGPMAEGLAAKMRADAMESSTTLRPLIEKIANVLNLNPDPNTRIMGWGMERVELPPPPVPKGWRYERTNDFVGILAPCQHFDPHFTPDLVGPNPHRTARGLLRRNSPASALYVLKQHAIDAWRDQSKTFPDWLETTANAYEALGRPLLAQSIRITQKNLQ